MTDIQKVCIMSFDEIKIRKVYLYDKANDETLKPYSFAQVVMLRGLFMNWKQPIFFDYDCKMIKALLYEIIKFVEKSGFQIVGLVSDLGGSNRSLHNELEISCNKTWFKNPANEHNIYVFADVPHLVKLIRNHYVDNGLIINNEEINKSIIEKMLDATTSSDLTITHKISKESLNVKKAGRQNVKCGIQGKLEGKNWMECAEFFKQVNDRFDCLNVRVPEADSRDRMAAYGKSLDIQQDIIKKMTNVTMGMEELHKVESDVDDSDLNKNYVPDRIESDSSSSISSGPRNGGLEELSSILGPDQIVFISQDEKAKIPIEKTAAKVQVPVLMHPSYKVRLDDHNFAVAIN